MRFIVVLVVALIAGAMLVSACGGGDEIDLSAKDGKATTSASKESGGDKQATPEEDEDGGGGTTSKDAEEYASDFCNAVGKYADDIQAVSDSTADMEDPTAMKDMIDQMIPILEGLAKDLDKIDPPSDVQDWHEGLVSGMGAAADLFTQMSDALDKPLDEAMAEITDLSTQMSDMEDPFGSMGDLPAEYQTALEENKDCQALEDLDLFQ
jgi:hypothetical protein